MKILGVSAFYHDSAAALLVDGELVAAAQEERFTRKKFDSAFPRESIQHCLARAGLSLSEIDEVVYYEKPFLSFERLAQSIVSTAPESLLMFLASMPIWMREKLNTRATIQGHLKKMTFGTQEIPRVCFSQHHLSHAASAFFPSPFENSAVLCADGVGEWATTSGWVGNQSELKSLFELRFPHSLGLLYSAFTYYCGFKVNSGEYKLMGLAPYGKPLYQDLILDRLIDLKSDGSFRMNMDYFAYVARPQMIRPAFEKLFGVPVRHPEGAMPEIYKDVAASIQKVTEEIMVRMCRTLRDQSQSPHLCLAGGVALNCVANGRILRERIFEEIWIQPAAGDAGGALGAALASYHLGHKKGRNIVKPDLMRGARLGPEYSDDEIESELKRLKVSYQKLSRHELVERAADELKRQNVVGWFQGSMEYGPRALGGRSILGDPRDPQMQARMNLKIKFRESFRPFAPILKKDAVGKYFSDDVESPYMLMISHVNSLNLKSLPAVTHVDGSARLQTVTPESDSLMSQLLEVFEKQTGCPVLINTSFNVRGEPIVCTPFDAIRCFVRTDMDSLFVGSFFICKEGQSFNREAPEWEVQLELD
jgi:carbamoyltransferase